MAIRYKDLNAKTRTITVYYDGESLDVTYRLNAITPAALRELRGLESAESLAAQVGMVVESWDVLDDKGQRIKPTREFAEKLPVDFLAAVITGIVDDVRAPDGEEKKD
ncbi:MAG: hypothetical protein HPY45_08255 [Anaerolineae bacterium]|nr:hypothetical protein [Anaerolineae bacterium]